MTTRLRYGHSAEVLAALDVWKREAWDEITADAAAAQGSEP